MPSRIRALLRALCLVACLTGALVGSGQVSASEAAIVVRHGDGAMTYALVVFPEDEISAMELLRRSGISLVTVSFGGLGDAVCTVEGEGCGVADCRKRLCQTGDPNSPYWHYFRQTSGVWTPAPLGASSSRVRDGDIDGWVWTSRDPGLPLLTIDVVRTRMGVSADTLMLPADGSTHSIVRTFDAQGQLRTPSVATSANERQLIIGAGMLAALAILGVMIARRHRHLRRAR